MSSAGQLLEAGRIPGERIDQTIEVSDSANIGTTETVVLELEVPLVSGRTYRVWTDVGVGLATASATRMTVHMREDSVSGAERQRGQVEIDPGTTLQPWPWARGFDHEASSTGLKTFVVTLHRNNGSASVKRAAASTHPSILAVDYVSG